MLITVSLHGFTPRMLRVSGIAQSSNYIVEFCITNLLTRQLDLPLLISRGQKDNRQNYIQTHFSEETPLHD